MCLLHIRALQSANNWCPQIHLLYNVDQTLGDVVASNDSTEDVNEDSRDLRVACDEIEGILDSLWCCTATNIEEVCWRAAVQLDDIHSRHCETGAVDEAANVAVEFDEVEALPEFNCKQKLGVSD